MGWKLLKAIKEGKRRDNYCRLLVEQFDLSYEEARSIHNNFRACGRMQMLEDLRRDLEALEREANALQTKLNGYRMTVNPDPNLITSYQDRIGQLKSDAIAYRQNIRNYL